MPSPKHPCAFPGCTKMVARKEATNCRKHVPRTREWIEKQANSVRGRKRSEEVKAKLRAIHTGPGNINRTCEHCCEKFTTKKPSSKQRFCSSSCGYANRSGEKASNWNNNISIITCSICGEQFRPTNSTTSRYTCSDRCRGIRTKKNQKNKNTNIEVIMRNALICNNISFIEQYIVPKVGIPDFFIPKNNVIVFCDGDYWHSIPSRIEKDTKQTHTLEKMGYLVFRFLGSEIISNLDLCIASLINHEQQNTLDI